MEPIDCIPYRQAIAWIVWNRAGQGGWPPTMAAQVCGWLCVRMVAELTGHPVLEVALDVIELAAKERAASRMTPERGPNHRQA